MPLSKICLAVLILGCLFSPSAASPTPLCNVEVYYAHKELCNVFYQCLYGRTMIPQVCSKGLVWNEKVNTCDFQWRVDCKERAIIDDFDTLRSIVEKAQRKALGITEESKEKKETTPL